MRFHVSPAGRAALVAVTALVFAGPVGPGSAFAQDKAAQDAPQPKQVALTQKTIDGLIAAQKDIRDIEAKAPKDAKASDAKLEGQIDAAVKKNGFASVDAFADTSFSVGVVIAGVDPDTGKYVGAEAATKKQIDAVKADKEMAPKEKKEALDELNETLKAIPSDKPLQGNIDLVQTNFSKLNDGLKQAD